MPTTKKKATHKAKKSVKHHKVVHSEKLLVAKESSDKNSHSPSLRKLKKLYSGSRKKKAIATLLTLALVSVIIQLAYPHDRALPLSRLQANGFVGFSSKSTVLAKFQDFDSRTVTVNTHSKNLTSSYTDLGVTLKADDTFSRLSSYSTLQRLIPFSILIVGNKTFTMDRSLEDSQLELFYHDLVTQTNELPRDAVVSVSGTTINVIPSKPGYEYQQSYLKSQILRSDLTNKAQIVFKPTILPPSISSEAINYSVNRMQQRINSPLTIHAEGDHSIVIDSKTLASWVEIKPQPVNHTTEISFSKVKIAAALRSFPATVDITMQPVVVTLLNGTEAGRTQGKDGKVLNLSALVDKVAEATSAATETVEAPVSTIIPTQVFDRRYSKDTTGMQNLLDFWTANHQGSYSIDFRTLNGRIEAGVNPYRLFSNVGVYRIYIASLVYGRMSAGSLNESGATSAGYPVGVCLDKMIRESHEACTNVLGDIVGWAESDYLLKAQGFENTTLARSAGLTTANDASDWLIGLLNGSLVLKNQANSLTGMMKGSSIRTGIPSGSAGISVANKSGSFGRFRHDIGVIYHPGGTYVLSVLSEGGSFAGIADLTTEINKVMNQ